MRTRTLLLGAFLLSSLARGADTAALERKAVSAAKDGRWHEALDALQSLREADASRYAEGRFDYLAARSLAATGKADAALERFERFIGAGDVFDVPARLSAATLRFGKDDGLGALGLLTPLFRRREGAVFRRAIRITLNALETKLDPPVLSRLQNEHLPLAPRERRRLEALEAEALEAAGDRDGAERVRLRILSEARRDDAAAIVLARELRGLTPEALADRPLALLTDTARAQRDLELAEKLATERVKRAEKSADAVERLAARFDRARLLASRGRFVEAKEAFAAILESAPQPLKKPAKLKDDSPGTPAFLGRVRFNLGAVLEKLGELDAAERELKKVETAHIGPWGLAALQRARLNLRRSRLDAAEAILLRPSLAKESGRIEGLLLLAARRCEAKDPAGARRALLPIDAAARVRRLPEPWKSELPFWHGRLYESAGDTRHALEAYADVLAAHPYSAAAEIAEARLRALEPAALAAYVKERRSEGERLLHRGDVVRAKERLLPPALLGDAPSRDLLKLSYERLPEYAAVLLAPEIPDETLATLCGDAGACRLLQLGLPEEAEPIVRDARRLDTLTGCVLAARLAEGADAGPAALEAAEALDRKVPDDFFLELAPHTIRRALAPRPFDRLVGDAAEENGVPRDLLYAVMRQESRFDHEAASPAAARGLMQLTLPAAGEAARERNESPPAYLDLYDPSRSLLLGARTLAGLLARFGGAEGPVVAAYNAGAGQTSLWLGGSNAPEEALLASISYPETRTYFRRVLANRLLYRLAASGGEPAGGAGGAPVRR